MIIYPGYGWAQDISVSGHEPGDLFYITLGNWRTIGPLSVVNDTLQIRLTGSETATVEEVSLPWEAVLQRGTAALPITLPNEILIKDAQTAPSNIGVDPQPVEASAASVSVSIAIPVINTVGVTLQALSLSPASVSEDVTSGTLVGTVLNTTSGGTVTLIDDSGGLFTLVGGRIFTAGALDFSAATSHNIILLETHPDATARQTTITIQVTNVFEVTLVDLALSSTSVVDDITAGTFIATISNISTAPPATSVVTLSEDAGGRFAIASNNQLVAGLTGFDFSAAATHDITLLETHLDALPRETNFTITVTDASAVVLNALTLSSSTVAEDAAVGTAVGVVNNTTSGGTVTLIDDAGGLFALSSGSIVTAGALDFETATSHEIILQQTHPNATTRNTTLTITVTDVVESAWQVTAGDASLTVITSPAPPSQPTAVAGDGSLTVS